MAENGLFVSPWFCHHPFDWVSQGFPLKGIGIGPLLFDFLPVHDSLVHVESPSDNGVRSFAVIENVQKKASIPAGRVMGISTA